MIPAAPHHAVAANVLGRGSTGGVRAVVGARAGAGNEGNTPVDVLGGDCSRPLHFVVGEGAVAAGRAEDADAVDTVLDLIMDRFAERRFIDLLAFGLGGGRHEGEDA